jgi:glycosyltransferase involved in cell wall biosynthesis
MVMVSFVIPTYNRAATLAECLAALDRERVCGIPFEVIVVDDGSSDGTIDEVRCMQERFSVPLRLLYQENRGPAIARNRGVAVAHGELIVFLGDDIIVEPGYLGHLYAAYQSYQAERRGILGFTRYREDAIPTPFGRWLDAESTLQFLYSRASIEQPLGFRLFYTSNLLVPRRLLIEAGGFNQEFRHPAYEDMDLGYRLEERGFVLYYCPAATAVHAHQVSLPSFAARMTMAARAAMDLRRLNPALFALFHPRAYHVIGHPSVVRRAIRWFFAKPILGALTIIDSKLRWRVPGPLYHLAMICTRSRELTRLWREAG